MQKNILEIRNLNVFIDKSQILHSINLEVNGYISVIGRNGAGKTTLMRTIMGFLPVESGSIILNSKVLSNKNPYNRTFLGLGYMPEDRKLVPSLTVLENISIPCWALSKSNIFHEISWIFELIPELHELKNRKASSLSGGQQKLVSLSRALAAGTKLLLLDEPFEGVAPALADRILNLIIQLKKKKISAIISESDEKFSYEIADKIYTIERGEIK